MQNKQVLVDVAAIPSWMKEQNKDISGNAFDTLIKSAGAYITERIFVSEFLPLFLTDDPPDEAKQSYLARFIHYAHQPYNAIDVYEDLDEHGGGINYLFTVPPVWNGRAPILKKAAAEAVKDSNGHSGEHDPSLFRSLVARINLLTTAGDTLQLMKHRDHFLPQMVAEKVAIELDHLKQWHHIFERYNVNTELANSLRAMMKGQKVDDAQSTESKATSDTIIAGEDDF